ncbi:Transmembrane emp24 domain-containing protein eca [Portunus trituberculatus]|uniref:Transmembrane emp24 domain-containing protein eca n=1 Tax=Portunus trituberculatus TaxID=210409 RepID=A0A5B7GFK4_PORTR|nr:Transmembrane emp24 domain-containing protein eca [Portunus trituberculatus]
MEQETSEEDIIGRMRTNTGVEKYYTVFPAYGPSISATCQQISDALLSNEKRFIFTSHTPGEYVICLYSNSTKVFSGSQLLFIFDVTVGVVTFTG